MAKLIIQATKETPTVELDGQKGLFSISGKCYPENVTYFFKPILDYIEIYKEKPNENTTLVFNWLYYNTATTKNIIKIIMRLKDLSKNFQIDWICKKEFDLIIEKGKELKEILNVNMNIIEID